AVLLGDGLVHGGDRRRHAVDGQRHADAIERDAGECVLHVGQRVHGHADPADLAFSLGIVRVQAKLRRQVERDVERILTVGHQVLESGVGLDRRAEAHVLTHRPEPVAVHVLVDAARVRILPRPPDVTVELRSRDVLGPVDRRDGEAGVRLELFHWSLPFVLSCWNAFTISGSGVPIGNTWRTPSCFSASTSRGGMIPPTTTLMSPASCARSPSMTRRASKRCAPESTERPTTSTSSWIASLTISCGVRLSPE